MNVNWMSRWKRLAIRAATSLSARTWLVILLTLGFVGAFVIVIGLKLTKDHQTRLIAAEREATSIVGSLSAQLRGVLLNVESLMDYAAVSHGAGTSRLARLSETRSDQVHSQVADLPWVHHLTVIDAKGSILFDTFESGRVESDLVNSSAFQYHAENAGDALFISVDITFRLSKRLDLNNGNFAGVAITELSRDSLNIIRRSADLNRTKQLILSGGSGRILAESPFIADGAQPYVSSVFGTPRPPIFTEDNRALAYTTGPDGDTYLVAAQQLRGLPFTLYLAEPVRVILAPWYESLRSFALMILIPGLFGAGGCGILICQIERRSAAEEARLRDAVDSLSESFALWDAENKLVLCNQKFAEFYQIDPKALRPGNSYDQVMAAAAAPGEVVYQSETDPAETVHRRPRSLDPRSTNGIGELQYTADRWIYVSRRTTRDDGQVSVGTDVTPLKDQELELLTSEEKLRKYAQQLEKSQEKLQREADERAELALKYATEKTRAEEANRSKTEFLANMSHELRTPLNAVMGFAQIMQNGMFGPLGDDRYVGYTKDILNSGQHLIDLISDILDMSKIESGKTEFELNEYALDDIVRDCVRIIEPRVFEASLHLETRVRDVPTVIADKRATKQILLNLMNNAVKFTSRGGTIIVRGEIKEKYVALVVEDTGIGIAEQNLGRIGKPFEQIESQQNKKHKGTGLGLALSKSLAELQGGELRIKSQLGLGTTVTVTLPRADAVVQYLNERQKVRA